MKTNKTNRAGVSRITRAAICSWKGFKQIWRDEEAFKQEVVMAVILLPAGVILGDNGVQRALLISSVLLVMMIEILNTAIECAIDRISTEQHKLSGYAKDLGSAAVFMSFTIMFVTWGLILFS